MAAPWKNLRRAERVAGPGTKTVDGCGDATFHVSPTRHTYYVAVYAGDAIAVASTSIASLSLMVTATITGEMRGPSLS